MFFSRSESSETSNTLIATPFSRSTTATEFVLFAITAWAWLVPTRLTPRSHRLVSPPDSQKSQRSRNASYYSAPISHKLPPGLNQSRCPDRQDFKQHDFYTIKHLQQKSKNTVKCALLAFLCPLRQINNCTQITKRFVIWRTLIFH